MNRKLICKAEDCDENEAFEIRLLHNGRILLVCNRCGRRYELINRGNKSEVVDGQQEVQNR